MSDPPFDSQNAGYAQLLYEQFALNPASVPEEWRKFFALGTDAATAAGLLVPESLSGNGLATVGPRASVAVTGTTRDTAAPAPSGGVDPGVLPMVARATAFVQAYRDHGHMRARIDPLGTEPPGHPQLDPSFFGTSMEELDRIPADVVMRRGTREGESLASTLRRLEEAYSGWIGYEFEHLEDPTRVRWLWDQVESGVHTAPLDPAEKVRVLQRLSEVEGFEQFLHRTFLGQKRFSVEGNDMLVPILDLIIEVAADQGGRQVVLGMAHRGRLNVLAHTVGIGYEDILREFEGIHGEGALHVPGTGDVKYHHGAEGVRTLADGRSMVVTLAPNPSHLEFVNPVVLGMTRSLQFGDEGREAVQDWSAVIPVLIHGDAAFAAEGVVAETLNLGRLEGYRVGGALHVIVNNQVGFTTDPEDGRSTHYASGLAKGYDVPIIHVNADRPAACLAAVRLAMAYRAQYHDDILIDLVGYRRYGHNEGDEPAYTQPKLYKVIASHPTVRSLWADDLVRDGVLTAEDDHRLQEAVLEHLRDRQDRIAAQIEAEPGDGSAGADGGGGGGVDGAIGVDGVGAADGEDIGEGEAGGARDGEDIGEGIGEAEAAPDGSPPAPEELDTRVSFDTLAEVNRAAFSWPEAFQVHPKLSRQLERRRDGVEEEARLDWGHAETLAFGTILREGFVIRLTGQDVQRGTFSHRHVVLHDVETGEEHTPLHDVGDGRFEIYNSPLSEAAVLGYEYGYSVAAERDLILWEAQFGDFVNAAQVAIDQFVASGREKWNQLSNLTLLLPHGYEGQGPEHSSARLERFLQLCAEGNIRVAYPTTPAQQFHLLRRQAHARPEVPLVVMTPKSLLRLPAAASPVSDLVNGGFRAVLDDPSAEERRDVVTRLVLCTGKVYYDLQASPARADMDHVAIARLEELYPFPAGDLETLAASYPKLHEVVWAQEEPRNMGGLTFVGPRLRSVIPRKVNLSYVARPERASPAEGMNTDHHTEQARIVAEALGVR